MLTLPPSIIAAPCKAWLCIERSCRLPTAASTETLVPPWSPSERKYFLNKHFILWFVNIQTLGKCPLSPFKQLSFNFVGDSVWNKISFWWESSCKELFLSRDKFLSFVLFLLLGRGGGIGGESSESFSSKTMKLFETQWSWRWRQIEIHTEQVSI